MRGAMIYERQKARENGRYIELFQRAAARRGAALDVCYLNEIAYGYQGGKRFFCVNGAARTYDFIVMRAMRPLMSSHLENMNMPVFNNARVSLICNDKRLTARHFAEKGLPFVDTALIYRGESEQPFPYPVVVKAAMGCGGRQVFLCRDDSQYQSALQKILPDAGVVQPFLNAGGSDIRVYMLGGKPYQAMERYSDTADFRSNFGIHGHARPCALTDELERLASRAVEGLGSSLVGVDFLIDRQGRPWINEIEDAVGTRMLYELTDKDVVDQYMQLIFDEATA